MNLFDCFQAHTSHHLSSLNTKPFSFTDEDDDDDEDEDFEDDDEWED